MNTKITLIGAGSVVFAKNLIGDILQFPELSDITLCLMDIDPQRLKVAEIMTRRMISVLKVKARVIATLDQRNAIRGARYVICTVQVGGYKPGTVIDFEIPRQYGLLQTIGDTLGIGGIFRALRTIPVVNSIARDIAEVGASGCLLLNYSNPMAMNCIAVAREVGIPHVGLCHSVQGTSQQLASYIGLPYEDITYLVAGINHMAFFLKFEYRGQDVYPLLFRLLDDPSFKNDRVRFEMMRRTGYFVTESSEHQSEYVPYFIHHGKEMIAKFDVPIDEYLRRCISGMRTWHKTEAALLGEDGTMTVQPQSHEYGSFIIHSRETNTPRVIYGNVPNTDLITNLPAAACVEVPCLVDAQGIQPTHVGTLPTQLAAICQTNVNVQVLAVEAALTRKREHIYHAAMLDPHTAAVLPLDKIWAMCDDLIAAHQKVGLLGDYAPVIQGTGRSFAGTGDRILAEARVETPRKAAAGTLQAEVIFTNPGSKPVNVEVEVSCLEGSVLPTDLRPLKVRASVPARGTARKKVTFAGLTGDGERTVRLSSSSPAVLTRDSVIRNRRVLNARGGQAATFELKLAGFPAGEGKLSVRKSGVSLVLTIDDTKLVACDRPWEGSGLEIFFASEIKGGIRLFILSVQGGKKIKVMDDTYQTVPGITAKMRPNPAGSGYELSAEFPAKLIGPVDKGFLFDLVAYISALGEAHSGGRTSLSGAQNQGTDSSRYLRVEM